MKFLTNSLNLWKTNQPIIEHDMIFSAGTYLVFCTKFAFSVRKMRECVNLKYFELFVKYVVIIKGTPIVLRQFLATEKPLKMI